MKPGRKLVLEAVPVPLMIVVAFWGLFYFRPRVPSQKMNITISGLITAVVSFFIALVMAFSCSKNDWGRSTIPDLCLGTFRALLIRLT